MIYSKMELMTFNEWSEKGFRIIKGSKSTHRNEDGVALFRGDQVVKIGRGSPNFVDDCRPSIECQDIKRNNIFKDLNILTVDSSLDEWEAFPDAEVAINYDDCQDALRRLSAYI